LATTTSRRAELDLFAPIKTERTVDAVVSQILDLIQAGRLAARSLLPGERRLAEAMGVSRRTVRDAIEILEDAGVLAVEPGSAGGARVASIWIPESLSAGHEELDAEEVFSALEARRVVEPRVTQLAAVRGLTRDFEAMAETIALQDAHRNDSWQVTQGNIIFHRLIWRASRNPDLELAMRSIYRRLSGPLYYVLRDESIESTLESIELHRETLDAMRRGNLDVVDEVMDRHLRYLEDRCERTYGRPRLPQVPGFLLGPTAHQSVQKGPTP
jgi:GntR family transcriptional regulator, transcriptional repressor for pyruvate dehydrogenase complex